MGNIQRGDRVVTIGGLYDLLIIKTVSHVNPSTLALVSVYEIDGRQVETALEPRQHPDMWRKYDRPRVIRMKQLTEQIGDCKRELGELYKSLPKIEISKVEGK